MLPKLEVKTTDTKTLVLSWTVIFRLSLKRFFFIDNESNKQPVKRYHFLNANLFSHISNGDDIAMKYHETATKNKRK